MNKRFNNNLPMRAIGALGESQAEAYLHAQGLKTLDKNFHSRFGEIDLIMKDHKTVVFVEVKRRKNTHFGSPIEFVTHNKQEKLRLTAHAYLMVKKLSAELSMRFDVLGIVQNERQLEIEWIKNAF